MISVSVSSRCQQTNSSFSECSSSSVFVCPEYMQKGTVVLWKCFNYLCIKELQTTTDIFIHWYFFLYISIYAVRNCFFFLWNFNSPQKYACLVFFFFSTVWIRFIWIGFKCISIIIQCLFNSSCCGLFYWSVGCCLELLQLLNIYIVAGTSKVQIADQFIFISSSCIYTLYISYFLIVKEVDLKELSVTVGPNLLRYIQTERSVGAPNAVIVTIVWRDSMSQNLCTLLLQKIYTHIHQNKCI